MYTTTYQQDYSRGQISAAPIQTTPFLPPDSTIVSPASVQVEIVKHDAAPALQGSGSSTISPIIGSATGAAVPTQRQKAATPQAQAPAGPSFSLYPHAVPPAASEPSTVGLLDPHVKDSGPSVVGSKAFCARPCLPVLTGGLLGDHHSGRRKHDKQKASEQAVLESSIVRAQVGMSDDEALAAAMANEEADQVSALQSQRNYQEQQQRWEQGLSAGKAGYGQNSFSDRWQTTDEAIAAAMHQADVEEAAAAANMMYPPIIAAESRDVLLSGRLSRLPSVRLVPRVNSAAIPLQPHVSPDRARLLKRLEQYGLVERQVKGDGACQFRSLSDQLYGTPVHHDAVRAAVVNELHAQPERYQAFVPTPYPQYLAEMARPHTWGDHVTLQAAADAYGVRIILITSFEDNCVLAIEPQTGYKTKRFLWLSFYAEVHYNSVYPREEPPGPIDEPPKLLGSKRLARILGQQ